MYRFPHAGAPDRPAANMGRLNQHAGIKQTLQHLFRIVFRRYPSNNLQQLLKIKKPAGITPYQQRIFLLFQRIQHAMQQR